MDLSRLDLGGKHILEVGCGSLRPEVDHPYGVKTPRWFSPAEMVGLAVHPHRSIWKAIGACDGI